MNQGWGTIQNRDIKHNRDKEYVRDTNIENAGTFFVLRNRGRHRTCV